MLKKLDIGTSEIEQVEAFNALVDAVNELQKHEEQHLDLLTELNEMRLHQNKEPAENMQDDEIEQAKKWVGKLCWFSQIYECHQHIAILKRISESGLYVTDDGELHYAYCEPVKPDDDIIYKGDDNE